jgi:hypothetical protein
VIGGHEQDQNIGIILQGEQRRDRCRGRRIAPDRL